LGKQLHEDPQVPNYGKKGTGPKLRENMVIAIEPMINMGTRDVIYDADGWTVRTKDGKFSAHYEHTICIKHGRVDILSSFEKVIQNENANQSLYSGY
jgi:methionyl aminopeptidase